MNKESVKINITCAGGRVEEVESDAIYGCAVTEDGEKAELPAAASSLAVLIR